MVSENAKGWQTLDNNLQVHYSGQGYMQVMDKFRNGVLAEKQDQPAPSTPKKQEWQTDENGLEYKIFPFRMLSKSFIQSHLLDFSEGDVLQEAVELFNTKIFKNHNTDIENSIGLVINARFSESFRHTNIAGIDADYKIYKKFGEDIADRIEADVLDSTSVGVRFAWKKSHPKLKGASFFDHLGYEVDGHIVRLIITKILRVPETSIVYAGADPNAKKLTFAGEFDRLILKETSEADEQIFKNEDLEQEKQGVNVENENLEAENLSLRNENARLETELKDAKEQAGKFAYKHAEAEKLVTELQADKERLLDIAHDKERLVEIGEKTEKNLREQAAASYKLLYGDKAKPEMLEQLASGTMETVEFLAEEFRQKLEELHPARCPNCNAKLTRASSVESKDFNPPAGGSTKRKNASDYKVQ